MARKRKAEGRGRPTAKRAARKAKGRPGKSAAAVKKRKRTADKPKARAGRKAVKSGAGKKAVPTGREREVCCKDIDLSKWNFREVKWNRKPFYVVRYGTFLHIPIGIGKAMVSGMNIVAGKYHTPYPELWLSKETGLFSAKMLFAVKKANPGDPSIEKLSGTFVTRGFQGPYKNMGNYIRVFNEQVKQKYGRKPIELYFWYANCPKCAKKQGGPKIVIFGRV